MGGEMPSIPGRAVTTEMLYELRRIVGELARTHKSTFPGSQPVSFTRTASLAALRESDYLVCEKSDGVRVLVLMLNTQIGPQTFFITRKSEYFLAPNAFFPVPNCPSFNRFHNNTLIDAELVIDTMPDGQHVRKLLAFDALVVAGVNCMDRALDKRLGYLQEHVIRPFTAMCAEMPKERASLVPFTAEMKVFHRSYGVQRIFEDIIPNLRHACDGVIFTSVTEPYMPGTCPHVIKWKPAGENSIDFRVHMQGDEVRLWVWEGGNNYSDFAPLAVRPEDMEKMRELEGRVVEAVFDPEYAPPAEWRFMRVREDKVHGNHASVVPRILESIKDGLEQKELMRNMRQVRENWKRRHGDS
ncbi:Dcp1p-Dcp2p decapping enzyme complex alpha subunit [Coemansia sp. RSA 2131]|nr:Dcp1p-Dcp2p decapping enzyme complex alpha subunit [Coemansia sp. RSA 2131]